MYPFVSGSMTQWNLDARSSFETMTSLSGWRPNLTGAISTMTSPISGDALLSTSLDMQSLSRCDPTLQYPEWLRIRANLGVVLN